MPCNQGNACSLGALRLLRTRSAEMLRMHLGKANVAPVADLKNLHKVGRERQHGCSSRSRDKKHESYPLPPSHVEKPRFDRGQNPTHFQEESGSLALLPKAARPTNRSLLENVWCLGLGAPGLQKSTWPKKHFRVL